MTLLDRSPELVAQLAADLVVDARALRAILQVESAGEGIVAGRPLIRLEAHLLWRAVPIGLRPRVDDLVRVRGPQPWEGHDWRPTPSSPWVPMHQPGASGQVLEWQVLGRARQIDHDAADSSTSWGLGQVLGSAWKALGYASLDQFVQFQADEPGQLRTFGRFLEVHGLIPALNAHDWYVVAATYNGVGQAEHYARDLSNAYAASA